MNKKIIIAVAILALVAVALVMTVALKDNTPVKKAADPVKNNQTVTTQTTGDADIDAITKDLESVSADDFNAEELSDQNVGL